MSDYVKRQVRVQAFRWAGRSLSFAGTPPWAKEAGERGELVEAPGPRLIVRTLNGSVTASVGEWIVRGVAGELYPCRNDIFRATYEEVREVGLGPAELEVVRLVAEGYSSREIATLRGVSVKTVESQRTSAMQKVGANRTALLVRYAVHVGLVSGMPKTEGA